MFVPSDKLLYFMNTNNFRGTFRMLRILEIWGKICHCLIVWQHKNTHWRFQMLRHITEDFVLSWTVMFHSCLNGKDGSTVVYRCQDQNICTFRLQSIMLVPQVSSCLQMINDNKFLQKSCNSSLATNSGGISIYWE